MNLVTLLLLGRLGHQGSAKNFDKITIKLEFGPVHKQRRQLRGGRGQK